MINERSAGFVLYRQLENGREYLLLNYPGGHIDFAKGHVEPGETDREAAYRELQEETGIKDIVWIEGYKELIDYTYNRGPNLMHKDVIFFLARTTQKKVTISDEHRGFEWLPYKEALEKLTFKSAKDLLRKAESFLNKN